MIGTMIMLIDVCVAPVQMTFNLDVNDSRFLWPVSWATASFWTLDIIVSFTTTYTHDGIVEDKLRTITIHYLKGWFLFDFVLCIMEWFLIWDQLAGTGKESNDVLGGGQAIT